ncbi:MAG: hypothetical protein EXR71_01940 [Myxococcales bacterium]|nr:hypothetical protein [Myxococcales bacterium]
MRLAPIALVFGLLILGCTFTDVKGATCTADDLFEAQNGDRYCLDPAAPAECEHVVDEIIDAFVTCADGAFTEDELREQLADEGVTWNCESAVATSTELDVCYADLIEPECDGGVAVITEACAGSVLAEE